MLLELLKLKAKEGFAQLKTTELGENLGISQQAASLQLKELEGNGLIAKKSAPGNRLAVKITEKGLGVIGTIYSDLSNALENEAVSMLLGVAARLTINCPVAEFLNHDPDT